MVYKETEKYIRTYGSQVESEIGTRLRNYGKYASGKLYESIGYKLTKDSQGRFILGFHMLGYGFWVDKGSKRSKYADMEGGGTGKSKFIESLFKWCQIKGLPKGAAFAIRRKIWQKGQAPTNFFTIPTTRRRAQFNKGVEKNMAIDVEIDLQKEINKLGLNKKKR